MAQTPHASPPPVPPPPPVAAIDTSSPRVARVSPRRRSKPWGWILGLCGAFAGGLLIGLAIGRGSARLPSPLAPIADAIATPATITETPAQQAIRAFLDKYLIQRDYRIVETEEVPIPADYMKQLQNENESFLGAFTVTLDITTPAEGTRRFVVPFSVFKPKGKTNRLSPLSVTTGKGEFVVFPSEEERFLKLFQFGDRPRSPIGTLE